MYNLCLKKSLKSFSFLKLSQTLDMIENNPSSLKKVQILSNYFNSIDQKQKEQTKKLFEFVNKKVSTGVSDKLLISNCKKILGGIKDQTKDQAQEDKEVQKNKETAQLIEKFISPDKVSLNIEIQEINNVMIKLTQISGKNAVQNKINEIIGTLDKLSFLQSRFFLRILTKDMKIGMKTKRIQKAFQQSVTEKQNETKVINPKTFNAMLARPLRDIQEFEKFCLKKEGKIIADVKYDGQRTLVTFEKGKPIELISRNGKQQNDKYFKIAEDLQQVLEKQEGLKSVTFDGQLLAVDKLTKQPLPFQVLLTRRRKVDSILPVNDDPNIEELIYVFDVLEYNGEKLYTTPLIERKKLVIENHLIKKGQYQTFSYPQEREKLMEYFHSVVKRKYQGLILKGPQDHYYTNGTRIHWGKLKKGFRQKKQDKGQFDLDLIIMGADYGRGKKSKFFSSFLIGTFHNQKIIPLSKLGTGFTDEDLQGLTRQFQAKVVSHIDPRYQIPKNIRMDVWFRPEQVVEVDCQQFSRSPLYQWGFVQGYGGISLRFPVFKRMRDDKNIQQATSGQYILQEMQKQQLNSNKKVKKIQKNDYVDQMIKKL